MDSTGERAWWRRGHRMRYVIMANGRGTRWGNHLGIPKHLLRVDGETLLRRLTRQVHECDPSAEVVVSAADPRYETEGARRHMPLVNELELDRFVPELIGPRVCFLYGDTFYSDAAISQIIHVPTRELSFFGDDRSIVAVTSANPALMLGHLTRVRSLYLGGRIAACRGWQVYQSYAGLPFIDPGEMLAQTPAARLGHGFHHVTEPTAGFNTPADYASFCRWAGARRGELVPA